MSSRAITLAVGILATGWATAATIEQIGSGHNWDITWQPISGLNDDIGGGASTKDATTSGFAPIPEPDPNALLLIALTGAVILRRRRRPCSTRRP